MHFNVCWWWQILSKSWKTKQLFEFTWNTQDTYCSVKLHNNNNSKKTTSFTYFIFILDSNKHLTCSHVVFWVRKVLICLSRWKESTRQKLMFPVSSSCFICMFVSFNLPLVNSHSDSVQLSFGGLMSLLSFSKKALNHFSGFLLSTKNIHNALKLLNTLNHGV